MLEKLGFKKFIIMKLGHGNINFLFPGEGNNVICAWLTMSPFGSAPTYYVVRSKST